MLTPYFFLQDGEGKDGPMQEVNIYKFWFYFECSWLYNITWRYNDAQLNSLTENSLRKLYFNLLSSEIRMCTCAFFYSVGQSLNLCLCSLQAQWLKTKVDTFPSTS